MCLILPPRAVLPVASEVPRNELCFVYFMVYLHTHSVFIGNKTTSSGKDPYFSLVINTSEFGFIFPRPARAVFRAAQPKGRM